MPAGVSGYLMRYLRTSFEKCWLRPALVPPKVVVRTTTCASSIVLHRNPMALDDGRSRYAAKVETEGK